jgi:two-component system, OmpR family, sensor histidine kinase KdpD
VWGTALSPESSASRSTLTRATIWVAVLAGVTFFLVPLRAQIDRAHVTVALLLVVLVAAADGGRRIGIAIAVLAFLVFNWFFLLPYGTLTVARSLDWLVLGGFLVTSVVASHLFHRVQREADDARARTSELTELSSLGEEAMRAPRAESALLAVSDTVRRTLQVAVCRLHIVPDAAAFPSNAPFETITSSDPELEPDVAEQLRAVIERDTGLATLDGGVTRVLPHGPRNLVTALGRHDAVRMIFPLRARSAAIGALEISDRRGIPVTVPRERLLAALTYYAALGADRLRLERASAHVEALRESDRLKNSVLASVSHDLRTPLTTIKALARGLQSLGDERAEIIEQEADRLNRFVADILDISRLTSGAFPLALDIVPVDDLISAALQQVEGAFGSRRIVVQLDGEEPLLVGRFDLTHTVRILVNLLENARKYAPPESPIELGVTRRGQWLEITVSDRGPGVPPQEKERIFEALYRPRGVRPDAGSAGLGLAIARGLADAQGGSLTYSSRPGGGSVFTLRLPAVDVSDLEMPRGPG